MGGPSRKCKAPRRESQSSEESQGSTSNAASIAPTKCRRLNLSPADDPCTSSGSLKQTPMHILNLPTELLEAIFKHLSFENIGKIRLVSREFNEVCSGVLNSEFQRVRSSMQQRFQCIKRQMPRRESARRKHKLAQESDIVETMHMRLTLLHMTFGKHIERKHCCFFAGEILDEVYRIIDYIKFTPVISRAYKVTDELFDLSTMAMEYFKERIEPTLPEITYITTDFFDYTPSFSLATASSLSLIDNSATSSACRNSNVSNAVTFTKGSPMPIPMNNTSDSNESGSGFCQLSTPTVGIAPAVKKRLRNLRDSVKRNNGQVLGLKRQLKVTQKRMINQQKQIQELKAHHEDYDKKFQNTSRKLNAVLQELSRCKTELQYWRSKSPANSSCICGKITPVNEHKDDLLENKYDKLHVPFDNENNILYEHLDAELENAFSEEFKPIAVKNDIHSPSCSSGVKPPLLVVPACHGKAISLSILPDAAVHENVINDDNNLNPVKSRANKPFTRATKRNLEKSIDKSSSQNILELLL